MAKVKLIKAFAAERFVDKKGIEKVRIEARYELDNFREEVLEDLKKRQKNWKIELGKVKGLLIISRTLPWDVFQKETYSHTNKNVVDAYKRAETNAGLDEFTHQDEELL